MTFGQLLHKLRKEKGLTLKQLSDLIGSSKGYLSGIENDKVNPPSEKFVRRLADILSVNEIEFLKLAYLEKVPSELKAELSAEGAPGIPSDGIQLLNSSDTAYPTEIEPATGLPAPRISQWIRIPHTVKERHIAVTIVDGDGKSASFTPGDIAVLDTNSTPTPGDNVFAVFRSREKGESGIWRLDKLEGDNVDLKRIGATEELRTVNRDDLDVIFPTVARVNWIQNEDTQH